MIPQLDDAELRAEQDSQQNHHNGGASEQSRAESDKQEAEKAAAEKAAAEKAAADKQTWVQSYLQAACRLIPLPRGKSVDNKVTEENINSTTKPPQTITTPEVSVTISEQEKHALELAKQEIRNRLHDKNHLCSPVTSNTSTATTESPQADKKLRGHKIVFGLFGFLLGALLGFVVAYWVLSPPVDTTHASNARGQSDGDSLDKCAVSIEAVHDFMQQQLEKMQSSKTRQTSAEKARVMQESLCTTVASLNSFEVDGPHSITPTGFIFPQLVTDDIPITPKVCSAQSAMFNVTIPVVVQTEAAELYADQQVIATNTHNFQLIFEKLKAAVGPVGNWYKNGIKELLNKIQDVPEFTELVKGLMEATELSTMLETIDRWTKSAVEYKTLSDQLWRKDALKWFAPPAAGAVLTTGLYIMAPKVMAIPLAVEVLGGMGVYGAAHLNFDWNPVYNWWQNFGRVEYHYAGDTTITFLETIKHNYFSTLNDINEYFQEKEPMVYNLMKILHSYEDAMKDLEKHSKPTWKDLNDIFQHAPIQKGHFELLKSMRKNMTGVIAQSLQQVQLQEELHFLVHNHRCVHRSANNLTNPCRNDTTSSDVHSFLGKAVHNAFEKHNAIPIVFATKSLNTAVSQLFEDFKENIGKHLKFPDLITMPPGYKSPVHNLITSDISRAKQILHNFDQQSHRILNAMTTVIQRYAIFNGNDDPSNVALIDENILHFHKFSQFSVHQEDRAVAVGVNLHNVKEAAQRQYVAMNNMTTFFINETVITDETAQKWVNNLLEQ